MQIKFQSLNGLILKITYNCHVLHCTVTQMFNFDTIYRNHDYVKLYKG